MSDDGSITTPVYLKVGNGSLSKIGEVSIDADEAERIVAAGDSLLDAVGPVLRLTMPQVPGVLRKAADDFEHELSTWLGTEAPDAGGDS